MNTDALPCRFKESFLWAAAKGGRVEECESLLQMGTGELKTSPTKKPCMHGMHGIFLEADVFVVITLQHTNLRCLSAQLKRF